jgi:hypothetical protein
MIVDKYGNYVRKFMWQLCGWDRVDICMTFHRRAFDFFFVPLHVDLTIFKIARLQQEQEVRVKSDFKRWTHNQEKHSLTQSMVLYLFFKKTNVCNMLPRT